MLEQKILSDYKQAMKEKQSDVVSALSFLRSQLKNSAIDKKKDSLDDNDVIAVIKKQLKQRLDSIEKFKEGGRVDLVQKEEKEAEILKRYLPQEMPHAELEHIIDELIAQLQACSMKDMGKVMKEVMARAGGRAENKLVSDIVRTKLSGDESSNTARA